MSYTANSGSFGGTGSDLGSLPYSPPTAPDVTPAQVPLTEIYQEHTVVENGSTQTDHYHAITLSAPFMSFSFEVLSQTGFSLVPSLTTIGAETNRLPARARAKCVT